MSVSQILIVGGNDIEQAFPRIQTNLNTIGPVSFIKMPEHENHPLPVLLKEMEPFIQNNAHIFYSYGGDSLLLGKPLNVCKKEFWELSTQMRTCGEGKKLFATALPVLSETALQSEIPDLNHTTKERANANGCAILDLYQYVSLRKTDMLDPKGTGLSKVGAELMGDVISAAILDLLKEGNDPSLPFVAALGDSIQGG